MGNLGTGEERGAEIELVAKTGFKFNQTGGGKMKTQVDIESRITREVDHFRNIHRTDFAKCYLWMIPTTAERDGGFLCASEQPGPEYELVIPQVIRTTGQDVVRLLIARNIIGKLPVLSVSGR